MNFRIDILDKNGIKQDEISDFIDDVSSVISVNNFGTMAFVLPERHRVLGYLDIDYRAELYFKYSATDWILFFGGLVQQFNTQKDLSGKSEITCLGYESLLARRINAYYADTTDKTKFLNKKAETVLKTLVNYNLTSNATVANGRLRDGTSYPSNIITIEADSAGGNNIYYYCAYINILTALQDVCKIGGGDFSFERVDDNEFQIKWHNNQLGTDRRNDVIFAIERANMSMPDYRLNKMTERTVAIVGGQGDKSDRDIQIENASWYSADYDYEMFVDSTDVEYGDTSGLTDKGLKKLSEARAVESFSFDVLQAESTRFGIDYYLGDIVSAINPYNNNTIVQKVKSVGLELRQNGEYRFDVELELFDG